MLGLGSSLTSGVPESKYSAVFDGTSDYINLDSLASLLSDHMAFSLSIWFKGSSNDSVGNHQNILFSAHQGNYTNVFRIGLDAAGAGGDQGIFYSDTVTGDHGGIGGVDLDDGAWHNVIVTRPAGAGNQQAKIYIDGGSAITTNLDDCDPSWTNVDLVSIGQEYDGAAPSGVSDLYEGKIDEVGFWNVELDDASRLKVYNLGKPFNLKVDSGGYDNSSDLIGYWRMGNGFFDDKANGIVHDQNNPGFGSEIVTGNNATFGGANDWTDYSPSGTTGISTTGGALQVTLSGAGNGIDSGARIDLASSLTVGKTYKVEADIWLGTSSTTNGIGWRLFMGSQQKAIVLSTTRTKFVAYLTITSTGQLTIYNSDVDSDTGTFFIDNVSVKELNGNPGVTSGGITFSSDTP